MTADGVPSARTYSKNYLNSLAAFGFCLRKFTHVNRLQSFNTMSVYRLPPIRKIVDGVVVMIVRVYVDDFVVGGSEENRADLEG